MTEVQQQAQGIKLRQGATGVVPLFYEFCGLPAAGVRKGCRIAAVSSLKRR